MTAEDNLAGVRFIHTSDLQLGMTRTFLDEDAQARYSQARIDAIASIGELAKDEGAEFVVVAGDVFETNRVRPRTVGRSLEALGRVGVPVYLLPGNHDPLDAASVYRSPTFAAKAPANVHVLLSAEPAVVRDGVRIVGAPWTSKRPLTDMVGDLCDALDHATSEITVVVGHGQVDQFTEHVAPSTIHLEPVERAIEEGRVQYVALGDRHSLTRIGESGRVWYSGTPEPCSHDEVDPGHALVVHVTREDCQVVEHRIGRWAFVSADFDLEDGKFEPAEEWISALTSKERSVVRLSIRGITTLSAKARFDAYLEEARETFGSIEIWDSDNDLVVRPDDDDFSDLMLSGFARRAVDRLRADVDAGGPKAVAARDALTLLVRQTPELGRRLT